MSFTYAICIRCIHIKIINNYGEIYIILVFYSYCELIILKGFIYGKYEIVKYYMNRKTKGD